MIDSVAQSHLRQIRRTTHLLPQRAFGVAQVIRPADTTIVVPHALRQRAVLPRGRAKAPFAGRYMFAPLSQQADQAVRHRYAVNSAELRGRETDYFVLPVHLFPTEQPYAVARGIGERRCQPRHPLERSQFANRFPPGAQLIVTERPVARFGGGQGRCSARGFRQVRVDLPVVVVNCLMAAQGLRGECLAMFARNGRRALPEGRAVRCDDLQRGCFSIVQVPTRVVAVKLLNFRAESALSEISLPNQPENIPFAGRRVDSIPARSSLRRARAGQWSSRPKLARRVCPERGAVHGSFWSLLQPGRNVRARLGRTGRRRPEDSPSPACWRHGKLSRRCPGGVRPGRGGAEVSLSFNSDACFEAVMALSSPGETAGKTLGMITPEGTVIAELLRRAGRRKC